MFKSDLEEAASVIRTMLTALLGVIPSSGEDAAQCRMTAGRLSANAQVLLANGQALAQLGQCFDFARLAGMTVFGLRAARDAFMEQTENTRTVTGVLARNAAIRLSLVTEARIIADMEFVSTVDVERVKATLNPEFAAAEEIAADDMDAMAYQGLVQLHASITNFLVETARPLPRLVRYRFFAIMPSLVTAQRLYYDAGRADELRDENKVVHPAFMPGTGRALSA